MLERFNSLLLEFVPGETLIDKIDVFSGVLGITAFFLSSGMITYRWMLSESDGEPATRGDLRQLSAFVANALSEQVSESLALAARQQLWEANWLTRDQKERSESMLLDDVSRAIEQALSGSEAESRQISNDLFNGRTESAERKLSHDAKHEDSVSASRALHLQAAITSLRDVDAALAACRRAVELTPDDALGWSRLAHLYLRSGDTSNAQTALERALAAGEKEAVQV